MADRELFIAFTLFGIRSEKMKVMAISNSSRYTEPLFCDFNDVTESVPGMDGEYYVRTDMGTYSRPIELFVDHVTESEYRQIKSWLNPKRIGKLTFSQNPYKYYIVKLQSKPDFSYIATSDNAGNTLYVGNVTIELIAYNPFAYSYFTSLEEFNYNNPELFYDSGILYSDYNLSTSFENITQATSILLYNGGNERSKCNIKINGQWTELTVNNLTTSQSFTLSQVAEPTPFEVDSVYGQTRVSDVLASSYHEGSYIEIEGNDVVTHYEDVNFINDSDTVTFSEDTILDYDEMLIGRYLLLQGSQYKIAERLSDNELRLETNFTGTSDEYNVVLASLNEIHISGVGVDIHTIEFEYKYTYL